MALRLHALELESNLLWQGTWYEYASPGIKSIDDGLKAGTPLSNPFNDIGKAWTLATLPESDGVNRVGRGFPASSRPDVERHGGQSR